MNDIPNDVKSFSQGRALPGILLVAFGLFFLIANLVGVEIRQLWPVFLLGPSIFFFIRAFIDRTQFALLMPATILFLISGVFITCELIGWTSMHHLWPVFILAPGLGFFMLYWFGRRERGLLIPGSILTGLGLVFLLVAGGLGELWPAVLIVAGVILLVTKRDVSAT
jgi:hypothetical protein